MRPAKKRGASARPRVLGCRGLAYAIRRCVLCRSERITTESDRERFVTATCSACRAVVRVEFDPPDDRGIQGRIEVLVEPVPWPNRGGRLNGVTVH